MTENENANNPIIKTEKYKDTFNNDKLIPITSASILVATDKISNVGILFILIIQFGIMKLFNERLSKTKRKIWLDNTKFSIKCIYYHRKLPCGKNEP